ncbi:hypothetical protein HNQ80_001553 [Anaerosolibacter carboniphilus]|uniref:Uncharacterized protein n=1 Tax=Anaerosolibacter carboniphilus TaxID=1417629 RepID=A0A841KNU2_9FIRM|nr:hypothetical protein [Anaerosolibacter carboniphilus]
MYEIDRPSKLLGLSIFIGKSIIYERRCLIWDKKGVYYYTVICGILNMIWRVLILRVRIYSEWGVALC